MSGNKNFISTSMDIVDNLIDTILKYDNKYEQEKQVLGTYIFGVINGLAQEMKEEPAEVQSAIIQILNKKLNYSLEASVQFSQFLINSTDKSFHPTMFAIIHRGLEGYYQYKEENIGALVQDLQDIVEAVRQER